MAGKHSGKKNRQSGKGKARRRALGLGGSAGAFLAFGLTPLAGLASAPPAHADGLDAIIDPILNSILSSVTSFDALLGIDPSALGDLALPATDAAAVAPSGWEALFGDFTNPVSDASTVAGTAASVSRFHVLDVAAGPGAGLDQLLVRPADRHRAELLLRAGRPGGVLSLGCLWVYLQRHRRYRGRLTDRGRWSRRRRLVR